MALKSGTNKHVYVLWMFVIAWFLGAIGLYLLSRPHDPNQALVQTASSSVNFPLYYPAYLPSYYFIDRASITTSNNVVIFSVTRNDGESITVSEQSAPQDFNLSQVTGTSVTVPGLGTVVVGTGFLGYRAVIKASQTLIIVSSSDKISSEDFSSIVKGFRQA